MAPEGAKEDADFVRMVSGMLLAVPSAAHCAACCLAAWPAHWRCGLISTRQLGSADCYQW